MEWIQAHWTPGRTTVAPARALVAGCGTGAEAFAFSRRFPHAEIVAVDFSRRTIEIAREYQQRARDRRNVRFVVADLSSPGLNRLIGGDFDLISCYGVLSYVPKAARVFENLSRCLASDGALGVGVNGAGHASVGMRAALPGFGYDVSRFADEPRVWQVLSLFDALLGHTQLAERVAARSVDVSRLRHLRCIDSGSAAVGVGAPRAGCRPALSEQLLVALGAAAYRGAGAVHAAHAAVARARLRVTRDASPGTVSHVALHAAASGGSALAQTECGRGLASSLDRTLSPDAAAASFWSAQDGEARLQCDQHAHRVADDAVAARPAVGR